MVRLLWVAMIFLLISGCSIQRTKELECQLPDGNAFIRMQRYDWSWLAYVLPHVTKEANKAGFSTYFKDGDTGETIGPVSGSIGDVKYEDVDVANGLCASFGVARGVPYLFQAGYMNSDRRRLVDVSYFGSIEEEALNSTIVSEEIKDGLRSETLARGGGAFIVELPKVTLEYALERRDNPSKPIVAVFHYESLDGGLTWSELRVSSTPKIFELGKSLLQQCFIARPVRIDNRRIKAEFPTCPAAEPAGRR